MNPAALSALAEGDMDNFLAAATPGGIERQETQGQQALIASTTLPKEIEGATRKQLTAIGFVFGDDADDLFVNVTLPTGWSKKATDHSMHSDLLDDQGRRRAGIFYKAAFYDRKADMHFVRRLVVNRHADGYEDTTRGRVAVCKGEEIVKDFGYYDRTAEGYTKVMSKLCDEATAWLDKKYPDHLDPLAYWD